MEVQQIKQNFGIIGNSDKLNRVIDIAKQVASTDLSVLITGESGVGKEFFPKIIHKFSYRKHNNYIAVNCGAIPEGTINSELFGHEKGSFTGAHDKRKGYFEEANNGTIFLDEIGELPIHTQARLLRVIETGEFIKIGSSKVQKTNVRLVAATNINFKKAIKEGKFREDLFYRLNTVPINLPSLDERREDIHLLFKKFSYDFAEKYRMPSINLDEEAKNYLINYKWKGNIRQLKNISEQISVIERNRNISLETLKLYIPEENNLQLPAIYNGDLIDNKTFSSEKDILYKILFDMKKEINDLKTLVSEISEKDKKNRNFHKNYTNLENLYSDNKNYEISNNLGLKVETKEIPLEKEEEKEEEEEFSLSLEIQEIKLIKKALEKHKNKRNKASKELGISERTLYRKIKEYKI